ncbi:hypothetical protein FVE85_3443 [Porphyridium purpureum]|uniref:Calcium-activated potassium channel BK alpha subunit domain-containing protein n=1 Tax=Porphyridium purpureum TaxID=35688 RepID=A0A5J4YGS4_PORPP|nr:hypothetical protein FVE85_3443 [Porphyridium purpureum]|eukprot:POR6767..scf228_30
MGMGTYAKSATEHVVLGGAPRFRLVQKFLDEFYSFPEHYNTHVVLLCNARDWLDDEWLSLMNSNAHLQKQCVYLEGSLSNLRDLERAQVADALCVFIMCDTAAEIAYREESEVTMSILSVRAFAGRIPVYALCLVRESVLQVNIALSERQQDNDDEYGVALCGSGDLQVRLERLSASFCHQVITWTLVTESLFSNGLSTLVANLVREDKPKPDLADLPWQIEYKVGASVRLAYAVVPRALDGMRYFSLASVLNDFGVVLLAMQRDPDEQDWEPMRTTSVLEHGRVLICFTFHPKEVISAILESAANFIARQHSEQGLSDTDSNASDHGQNELGSAGASVHHHHPSDLYDLIFGGDQIDFELATEHFDPIAGFHGSAADISSHSSGSDVATATPQSVTAPPPNKSATIASHASAVIADILREKASGTFAYGSSTASRTPSKTVAKDLSMAELVDIRRKAKLLYINQALPVELSGHIVICFSQRREMRNNLDYILTSIWQDRPAFHATRVPIVVVCAEFPAGIDHMYHRFRGILYFVQGNPSSVKTLRYAQYSRSRAIAISAAYAVNVLEADAMNLFTVMVLDFLLETSSKAFVCSLLHSEDSLKFLRPPPRARRRRVHLGEVGEISMHLAESHPAETILAVEEHREGSEAGENAPEGDVYIDSDDEAAPAGGRFGARPLSSPRLIHRTAAISQNLANQRIARTRSLYLLDGGSLDAEDEEEEDDGDFEDGDEGGEEEQRTEFHTQDSDTRHSVEYGRARPPKSQFLTLSRDREAGTCSSRRIVDESSERQRFASGETYIQNLYVATMVREFAQPGIWSFLQLLLGMKTKRKLKKKGNLVANQNWIRLLDIPLAWVEEGELSSGGRTYREVFEKMLEFGCLALGLYRGGGACVRLAISDEQASELNQFIPQSSSASAPAFVEQTPLLTRKRGQYKCKVTGRTTVYEEFPTAGNDLPYVLTSPEPFCQVSNTDGVYVLCHPSSEIPADWSRRSRHGDT